MRHRRGAQKHLGRLCVSHEGTKRGLNGGRKRREGNSVQGSACANTVGSKDAKAAGAFFDDDVVTFDLAPRCSTRDLTARPWKPGSRPGKDRLATSRPRSALLRMITWP